MRSVTGVREEEFPMCGRRQTATAVARESVLTERVNNAERVKWRRASQRASEQAAGRVPWEYGAGEEMAARAARDI